jgi:hypothetical protein
MCPVCMTTAALMVAGAASTSGLTALVVKKLRAKSDTEKSNPSTEPKGEDNGPSASRITK